MLVIYQYSLIDEKWNLKHNDSVNYVRFNIENRGGSCVRVEQGIPVAWCGIHKDGSLG